MRGSKVLFSHDSDEWYTPQEFYDQLDREFHFTVDPCATHENHMCAKYYTMEEDGLRQPWSGEVVFCNPPYSQIKQWLEKVKHEHETGGGTIVLLLPVRTSTIWFHEYVYHKAEIRFIRGRLKFSGSKQRAPFDSMVVIYRKEER